MFANERSVSAVMLLGAVTVLLLTACSGKPQQGPTQLPSSPPAVGVSPSASKQQTPTETQSPSPPPPTPKATQTKAPSPTTEPFSWVGPLLFRTGSLDLSESRAAIPIFDLGAGKLTWLPTAKPVHRVLGWSPDGCHVAYMTSSSVQRRQVRVVSVATAEDWILPLPSPPALGTQWVRLCWSPTGEWIAYGLVHDSPERGIYLIRPDGSQSIRLTGSPDTHARPGPDELHGWSADGTEVLYWANTRVPSRGVYGRVSELRMLNVDSLEERVVAHVSKPLESWEDLIITDVNTLERVRLDLPGEPQDANIVQLFPTPDLRYFAVFIISDDQDQYWVKQLHWVDVRNGSSRAIQTAGFLRRYTVGQSPDGTHLAFRAVGFDEESADSAWIYVFDLQTGEVSGLAGEQVMPGEAPRWSPDGTMLSYVDSQGTAIYHFETREVAYLPADAWNVDWYADWSPRMAYGPEACQEQGGE